MVKVFGSEKRKRAYSAAQKNIVETGVLETALEPAFSHAQANIEKAPSTGSTPDIHFSVRGVISVIFLGSMPQDSGLMPPHNPAAESPQDVYDINDSILFYAVSQVQL